MERLRLFHFFNVIRILVVVLVSMMVIPMVHSILDPIALYLFDQDQCEQLYFRNMKRNDASSSHEIATFFQDLVIHTSNSIVQCLPTLGVTIPPYNHRSSYNNPYDLVGGIRSKEPIGSTVTSWTTDQGQSSKKGITIELWFKSPPAVVVKDDMGMYQNSDTQFHIMSFGTKKKDPSTLFGFTLCDQNSYDIQITQTMDRSIDVTFRTIGGVVDGTTIYGTTCERLQLSSTKFVERPNQLIHLVVSLRDRKQILYVNNQKSNELSVSFPNDLKHWNIENDYIFLLQPPETSIPNKISAWYGGTILQMAIYGTAFDDSDVVQQLTKGLPSTGPFAFTQSITIYEDTQYEFRSNDWHLIEQWDPQSSEYVEVPIVGSFDLEVCQLQSSVGVLNKTCTTNYFVYISELPLEGSLFDENGLEIIQDTTAGVIYNLGSDHSLIYVPPPNAHSIPVTAPFATFEYCVSVTPIVNRQECESTAQVNIIVLPVNDVPVAVRVNGSITIVEGNPEFSPIIPLLGDDVDIDDFTTAVQITEPPQHGTLHLAVLTFRSDNIRHGTSLSSLNYTIHGRDDVHVNYRFSGNIYTDVVGLGESITTDSFKFRVQDKFGTWSKESRVGINVVSAIEVISTDTTVIVNEDSTNKDNILHLVAQDNLNRNRSIGFFIDDIPSSEMGVFTNHVTKNELQIGSLIHATKTHSDQNHLLFVSDKDISFRPRKDFCHHHYQQQQAEKNQTTALTTTPTLRFRAVAFETTNNNGTKIVSASNIITQRITITCIPDVLFMKVLLKNITVTESSLDTHCSTPVNDSLSNLQNNVTGEEAVFCSVGTTSSLHLVEFSSNDNDHKMWKAMINITTGSGYLSFNKEFWNRIYPIQGRRIMSSGMISFYAYPEDLNMIFKNLRYTSFATGTDYIAIMVQYGKNCSGGTTTTLATSSSTTTSTTESESLSFSCQVLQANITVHVLRDENKYKRGRKINAGFPWQALFCITVYPFFYFVVVSIFLWGSNNETDGTTTTTTSNNTTTTNDSNNYPLERWILYTAENGMYYFENTESGNVTWQAPGPNEPVLHYPDTN